MQLLHIPGTWPMMTNTFLIVTEAHHGIVVDPAAEVQTYLDALAEHGAELTHIFLTHGHYDHVGAAVELRRRTGAKLYLDPADAQGNQLRPLAPDVIDERWPEQGGKLKVDELEFTVWHTPGHTKGSVCLYCDGTMFSGDTLFRSSCGRVDFPGGSAMEMQRSLSMLANLPLGDQTAVLPGHEGFTTLGQERRSNPYLLGEWG